MIIITIILIILLINFLFNKNNNKPEPQCKCKPTQIPGTLGSLPSNSINVYDSFNPVTLPATGPEIESLLKDFSNYGQVVLNDFKNNRNSLMYKHYIYADYKLNFLQVNNKLTDDQIARYKSIRSNISSSIENIFNYYLDIIKFNTSNSYQILRNSVINDIGTNLIITTQHIDDITARVINFTNIPELVLTILYNKISDSTKKILDQVITLSGNNYFKSLNAIYIATNDPPNSLNLFGVSNEPTTEVINGLSVPKLGLWSQLNKALLDDGINHHLVDLIRISLMTEDIYHAILRTFIKLVKNPKIEKAIQNLIKHCKHSLYNLISNFKFQFTYILLLDAITENETILNRHGIINTQHLKYPDNAEVSAQYSILPDYKSNFHIAPDPYDEYYNPISELVMTNNRWEENQLKTAY